MGKCKDDLCTRLISIIPTLVRMLFWYCHPYVLKQFMIVFLLVSVHVLELYSTLITGLEYRRFGAEVTANT